MNERNCVRCSLPSSVVEIDDDDICVECADFLSVFPEESPR